MGLPVFFVHFNQSNKKITTAEGELQIVFTGIGHLGRELENWHGHLTGNNFMYIYIHDIIQLNYKSLDFSAGYLRSAVCWSLSCSG